MSPIMSILQRYLIVCSLKQGEEHWQEHVWLLEVCHDHQHLLEVRFTSYERPSADLKDDLLLLLTRLQALMVLHLPGWSS